MKKTISSLVILLMFLVPALGNASYLIRLKNGGQLATPAYWTEGNWIFFYCPGGIAGMERREIDGIERDETDYNMGAIEGNIGKKAPPPPPVAEKAKGPEKPPVEAEPKAEKSLSPQKPPVKIDLKVYQEKMAKLKAELDSTLERIRTAEKNKDIDAERKARADFRQISNEIYKLTDELKEKNNGELPADWWEGK